MNRYSIVMLLALALLLPSCKQKNDMDATDKIESIRAERRLILQGNTKFEKGDVVAALKLYMEAQKANPSSPEAIFNMGVAQARLASQSTKSDEKKSTEMLEAAKSNLTIVTAMKGRALPIAAFACYNLGNMSFREEKYPEAIAMYQQALRINPEFNEARRNLRIAQLKQNENQDKKQDKNQDKNQDKDKNQDNDKDKDKDKDQQQNQQNQQDQQKNQQNQQQQQSRMNQQAAQQVLQAIDNKENATRARLQRRNQQKGTPTGPHRRW